MKIIIDTSVVIAVITNEASKSSLIEVTKGADLFAPPSVHWEIGNAFSAILKSKRVSLETSLKAIHTYKQISIQYVNVEISDALKIAHRYNIYAYDAYIIGCAIKNNYPLLSLDKNLLKVAKTLHVQIVEIPL